MRATWRSLILGIRSASVHSTHPDCSMHGCDSRCGFSFASQHRILFVSHQWLGFDEPDPNNEHYRAILKVTRQLSRVLRFCDDALATCRRLPMHFVARRPSTRRSCSFGLTSCRCNRSFSMPIFSCFHALSYPRVSPFHVI